MPLSVTIPAMPKDCGRPPQQEQSSEIPDQSRSGRVVRSADEELGGIPRRPARPTSSVEETVSDILAVPEQGPEQGEFGHSSDGGSVRFVIEQGHVLFGGTTSSGKSSAAAAILAGMQPGTRVRVIDPKSPWAMELIREAGEQ
jgi:hypothetical protein